MAALTPLVPTVSNEEFVPRDGVVAAGSDIFQNKLAAGDANPAFQILGNGELQWGAGGASALDTVLFRGAANRLQTNDQIHNVRTTPTSDFLFTGGVVGDGNARWGVRADGLMLWGDGTAAPDTTLYRLTANVLATDDTFRSLNGYEMVTAGNFYMAVGATRTGQIFMSFSGDSAPFKFAIYNNGDMEWGPGGGARDTNLYRLGANILATDDEFRIGGGGANVIVFTGGYQQFPEISAPANGAANTGRLFVEDNGAGKSRLAIIFASGAKQIIATEP